MEPIKLTKEELTALLTRVADQTLTEKVKELGLDKIDRKFGNFPAHLIGKSQEELEGMDKKAKVVEFVKAVFRKDLGTLASFKANMNEATGSAGGFIVPEEWAAEVNRVVEDFGLVAKLARKFPMNSDTMNVPRLSASVSVSYPGEATAGTASQPTFEQVQLLAKPCVGLTPMSNELLADANVDVVNLLTQLFAEAIAGEVDSQGFVGTGSPFTGIFGDSDVTSVDAASGHNTFQEITCDDARSLIANVKPWALQGAAFVLHRTLWSVLQKEKAATTGDYLASAANPILLPNAATQGYPNAIAGTLWGYPVYLSDKMPAVSTAQASTNAMFFGNLSHLWYGVRTNGLSIAISEHATIGTDNLFEQNMSGVRVIQRHAVAVGLPKAFAVLKTTAS